MRKRRIDIKQLLVVVFLLILMTVIASLTIGKDIYKHNEYGLLSFAIVNFFGYLFFFLLMPMELAFIFYLRSGYDPLLLNLIAVATSIASQTIDYLIVYSSAQVAENEDKDEIEFMENDTFVLAGELKDIKRFLHD